MFLLFLFTLYAATGCCLTLKLIFICFSTMMSFILFLWPCSVSENKRDRDSCTNFRKEFFYSIFDKYHFVFVLANLSWMQIHIHSIVKLRKLTSIDLLSIYYYFYCGLVLHMYIVIGTGTREISSCTRQWLTVFIIGKRDCACSTSSNM